MEQFWREMKIGKKYNRTIRKEYLDQGIEYESKEMKCITTKYGNKLVIATNFKGEMVDLFAPKRPDSAAADLKKRI